MEGSNPFEPWPDMVNLRSRPHPLFGWFEKSDFPFAFGAADC